MVSMSVAGALTASEDAAGVTVMPAGGLAVMVTLPLNPLMGESARMLVREPLGEIESAAFCVVREKSDWAMVTLTALEAAEL